MITVASVITTPTAKYIADSIEKAKKDNAEGLVILLDTPGGMDTAMRDIAKSLLNSPVPVIVYVYPSGARAASAGGIIATAGHGAALAPGTALVFAHGYNLLYSTLELPEGGDVVLVSPTAPGRVLRSLRERGETVPGYLAVHVDAGGSAWALAAGYAERLGCAPVWRTTVREETEVDLFGEQAVLCGGLNGLLTAAFDTLVEAGYAPEMAYLECIHQLKYMAELLHERGIAGSRRSISATALYGDLTRGPRVVSEATRAELRRMLEEVRDGRFARDWAAEAAAGGAWLKERAAAAARHPLEEARRRVLEATEGAP